MIRIREHISDTHATVDNAVAKSIIKGILNKLGVKGKVALTKQGREYANKYWNTGKTLHTRDGVFPLVVTCSYSEEYSKGALVNSSIQKNSTSNVLRDAKNNISVDVANVGLVTMLEMEFRSKSDNLIVDIENNLRLMRMDNTDVFELRAVYKYFMTTNAFDVVSLAGDDNIEDYMAENTDSRFTLISTIDGARSQYGFRVDTLIQVTITTETDREQSTYDSGDSVFVYTLSLRYMYERPTYIDTKYDYIINGKMIPSRLIPNVSNIRLINDLNDINILAPHNSVLDFVYGVTDGGYYIRIPEFDQHTDIQTYSPYTTIFSVLLEENPDNSKVLFNLNRLGELELSPTVLELLKKEREFITKDSESIFKLVLFCGNKQIPSEGVTIDYELNVIAPDTLVCNGTLRALFLIINDSSYLKRTAFTRLKDTDTFNLVKDLGLLNRATDLREMSFELPLPEKHSPEYIVAYSDVVVNYIRKV